MIDPELPKRSIWVHGLLDDLGLDSQAFRVFAHLSRRAGRGLAWPSIESITKTCQLSRNTVAAAILELEERGLIQVERRRGVSNRYRIAPISDWERAARIASPETYPTTPNPNTPTTTKRDTPTPTKRNTPPPPKEIHEVYQLKSFQEVVPERGFFRCRFSGTLSLRPRPCLQPIRPIPKASGC
jgi:DNA-binding transcriptional ArsR family regulator